jgi:hypothetical protein
MRTSESAKPENSRNFYRDFKESAYTPAKLRPIALTFGPDFIHWRRSGESWPSVWPGRRLFFLMNSPAAVAAQVRGRGAALGLATSPTGLTGVCSL